MYVTWYHQHNVTYRLLSDYSVFHIGFSTRGRKLLGSGHILLQNIHSNNRPPSNIYFRTILYPHKRIYGQVHVLPKAPGIIYSFRFFPNYSV